MEEYGLEPGFRLYPARRSLFPFLSCPRRPGSPRPYPAADGRKNRINGRFGVKTERFSGRAVGRPRIPGRSQQFSGCAESTLPFFGLSFHYAFKARPPVTNWAHEDLYLLAKLIQAEADGEPYAGQVAVGAVVLNRVKAPDFPNSIHAVIYQPGQFSCLPNWRRTGRPRSICRRPVTRCGKDPRGGFVYYNPRLASPEGARFFATAKLRRTVRIGNHIFFVRL